MIRKKLISGFSEESFSFSDEPYFTSCSIFSTPFPLDYTHTHTHKFCNDKGTILELLSKLKLPATFHWIAQL